MPIAISKMPKALRPPWSIAAVLTISMVGIIAVLMALLTVVDIRRERAFFRDDQQERGVLLVGGLTETLANHIYFNDVDALRDISSMAVQSRTDLDYIQMWAVAGSLLAASSKDNPQKEYPTFLADDSFGFESARNGISTPKFQDNQFQLTSPIYAGPDVVGIIQLGFNSAALDGELRSILIQHTWQALVLIAIGVVLSYLMARYASKPLREISASAAEIGQGNLDAPVPMRGARETAELGRSLTKMRDDLRVLYNDLEARVESRTSDLAEASGRLMVEVSERKAAEETLSHRNREMEQHSLALESIGDSVNFVDLEGNIQFVNSAFEQIYGYTSKEIVGRHIGMVVPPGDAREEEIRRIGDSTYHSIWSGETVRIRKDGEEFRVHLTVAPVRDRSGQVLGFVGVSQDITERKRAEEALREAEERYRLIFENARDAIMIFDLNSTIVSMNPEAELMTGYPAQELVGQRATVYLTPESARRVEESMRMWLAGERPARTIECEGVRKDGVVVPFEGRTQFIRDDEGNPVGYQGIFRDITERKRAEAERRTLEIRALAQSKLATLGEVATGVAHEINQPLTYISSMI